MVLALGLLWGLNEMHPPKILAHEPLGPLSPSPGSFVLAALDPWRLSRVENVPPLLPALKIKPFPYFVYISITGKWGFSRSLPRGVLKYHITCPSEETAISCYS